MLPHVLCVYWGFHSWWCSLQPGGLHGLLNLAISPQRMPLRVRLPGAPSIQMNVLAIYHNA